MPDCSFCLLGHLPNPLGTLDFSNGCAFLRNAFDQERVKVDSSIATENGTDEVALLIQHEEVAFAPPSCYVYAVDQT